MSYMYAAMFVIAGLILISQLSKENKIFYLAGGYFVLMGAWWCVDAAKPDWSVFAGVPGIIFKVITGIVLVIVAVKFFRLNSDERKKEKSANGDTSKKKGE